MTTRADDEHVANPAMPAAVGPADAREGTDPGEGTGESPGLVSRPR